MDLINIRTQTPYYVENNGSSKIMTPQIARLRNDTYSLSILIDINVTIKVEENGTTVKLPNTTLKNVLLGKIPIVVKSKYCVYKEDIFSECKYDPGGYLIVNGNEKVLITQEKVVPNIIHLYPSSNNNTKYKYIAEFKFNY